MEKLNSFFVICFAITMTVLVSCSEDDPDESPDNFDRQKMLANWADNFIIPGYRSYVAGLSQLDRDVRLFTASPSKETLAIVRSSWLTANLVWQKVGMYEIGKAEEITLINFTNIYPTATADLEAAVASGSYDLTSVNKQDEQGLPAIEYLIYGVRNSDEEIISLFANVNYRTFLKDLSTRLKMLAETVLSDWENGYRDAFVDNDGSETTSSVNKLVNDYIFYYEKHLRAGKIGIPAGVFSRSELPEKVEGLYSGTSKVLFDAALQAMVDFFNGADGESLATYLQFLNTVAKGEDLAQAVNVQFEAVEEKASGLSDNFNKQIASNNSLMLETYDELQKNVVNLKVDMLQALNIRVDFVDADGD
ncbi:MAG: imelysin family protein [Ekhidna sp.]|nr:imelysin family protein [Ekhidna sp.]